ncbi:MAG TPA: nuclear transport factor 2 family protein [Casimicrobiaceae bacterium]|nr:nuclear transport factor 2 family protein [Casimicrobiaceae bacterium]
MNAALPVQRQLEAYNAHDLERFVAEYADDVRVFRPPADEPVLSGKAAFAAHYAANRFNLPQLHAEVVNRIVSGNKVVDHERITGLEKQPVEAIAVYEVIEGRIRTVWFFYPA